MFENFVKSHIGQRELNEDSYLVDESLGLYIVADGVGGHDKGEVASKLTCKIIQEGIKEGMSLVSAIESAHQVILSEISTESNNKGMATTVVVIKFEQYDYEIAWVGDSRAYLWDGELKLLTRDHSYLELLFVAGHIEIDEFKDHPNKNVISQAIGIDKKAISVATNKGTLEKNQIILLASDGLYEVAKEDIIIQKLELDQSVEKLTNDLVDCAENLDGKDNITLLSIKNNNEVVSENHIKAHVVRVFDPETGKATELQEDIINQTGNSQTKTKKKVISESIVPKDLSLSELETKQRFRFKPLEMILVSLIFIALLVILNLKM